jgi:hypothetical protein
MKDPPVPRVAIPHCPAHDTKYSDLNCPSTCCVAAGAQLDQLRKQLMAARDDSDFDGSKECTTRGKAPSGVSSVRKCLLDLLVSTIAMCHYLPVPPSTDIRVSLPENIQITKKCECSSMARVCACM